MISEKTFLAYQEQAEGLIRDQDRIIQHQSAVLEDLAALLIALCIEYRNTPTYE